MRPPSPDAPPDARRARRRWWRAPREVRRELTVEALHPDVWAAAVAAAERAFGRAGAVHPSDPSVWTTGAAPRRSEVALWRDAGPEGVRLVAQYVRPETRPYALIAALLCGPVAVLVALELGTRPSAPVEWGVVAALLAVPVVVAVGAWVLAWGRMLVAARRLRRVLALTARVARSADPAAAAPADPWDDDPEPAVDLAALPPVGPSEWLTAEEIDGLAARDARIPRARAVAQATADRRGPALAPTAAEWL